MINFFEALTYKYKLNFFDKVDSSFPRCPTKAFANARMMPSGSISKKNPATLSRYNEFITCIFAVSFFFL